MRNMAKLTTGLVIGFILGAGLTTAYATGQVFLADGFTWTIEAADAEAATKAAIARAMLCTWSSAEIQEVCINHTQEGEDV